MESFFTSITPGNWAVIGTVIVAFLANYFKHRPDQTRAETEGKIADATVLAAAKIAAAAAVAEAKIAEDKDTADRFREFRDEVHGYRNQVSNLMAAQGISDRRIAQLERLLAQSLSLSSSRRDQMTSMLTLIELLIAELERLDKHSIIVPQAKALLRQMRESALPEEVTNSAAMTSAEAARYDAERTPFPVERAIGESSTADGPGK